ncbi:MAG TPA: FAD-containing oxidoreductase [Steroidobacteraceae bacterium]|nr:FAD-containing oxidoreductase [Steroidobacteraceae bacterium]
MKEFAAPAMNSLEQFDALIIGAGQAGPPLAQRLTAAGQKVCLIERKLFGGTCVNTGCMPTKTLVASAYAAQLARRAAQYGVDVGGAVRVDMRVVRQRAATVTLNARHGVEQWLQQMPHCTVVRGQARFESATQLRVGERVFGAPRIFINVGARAIVPDIPGLTTVPYLTNSSIVELDRLPQHLIILGGSYIGLEFAQMYRRFGSTVTVVERAAAVATREDPDVSQAIREILEAEGITIHTGTAVVAVARNADGDITVRLRRDGVESEVCGSDLLLATGRRPNTDDLGLAAAGVQCSAAGHVTVDDALSTSVPGIWALGECNGHGAFTHTAYNDFEIVAANLLDGANRKLSARIAAYALYIDPPLGRVGLTHTQAQRSGRPLLINHRPMTRVGRAVEKNETLGFMKIIADAQTRRILGAAILGVGGDEAIHGVLDLMNADQPYTTLQWAVPIHPTVSELLPTLVNGLHPPQG